MIPVYGILELLGVISFCVWYLIFCCDILLLFFTEEKNGESEGWVVSSESCCFQSIGAKYYREVQPGEIVQITKNGVKTLGIVPRAPEDPPAFCIFEYVYFSRPDSIYEGKRPGLQIWDGGGGTLKYIGVHMKNMYTCKKHGLVFHQKTLPNKEFSSFVSNLTP